MYLSVILLIYIINIYGFHLSPVNHKIINKLIQSNNISTTTRKKLNTILYLGYEKWALKNAYNFKKRHVYKCSRIPDQELINYARGGLYKSVLNYNGIYINGVHHLGQSTTNVQTSSATYNMANVSAEAVSNLQMEYVAHPQLTTATEWTANYHIDGDIVTTVNSTLINYGTDGDSNYYLFTDNTQSCITPSYNTFYHRISSSSMAIAP